jgi:hypothetical protein
MTLGPVYEAISQASPRWCYKWIPNLPSPGSYTDDCDSRRWRGPEAADEDHGESRPEREGMAEKAGPDGRQEQVLQCGEEVWPPPSTPMCSRPLSIARVRLVTASR